MSRQLSFSMDKETENNFLKFLEENDFILINDNGEILDYNDINTLFVLITRQDYLPHLAYNDNGVNLFDSLVIDYIRNNIIVSKKRINGGRIWISDAYKEEQFSMYKESFQKDYNIIKKWIQKNVPYQYLYINGKQSVGKRYISNSLVKLLEEWHSS